MRSRMKRFFAPPVFEGDEDKTRRARLLNAVLLLDAAGMGLMLTVDIISGDIPFFILGLEVAAIVALLWLRIPMYQGRITQASYGPLLLFLILTTGAVYFMGTTRDPTLGAFILLVVTAGLLLDRRAIFVTTAACILAVSIMMIAERAGRLPAPNMTVTLSQWGTITVLLVVSAWLTLWSRESIEQSLDVAQKELAVRRKAEEALRSRMDLEGLITTFSTRLINLKPQEIDKGIGGALADIGRFAGVDRSYVFLLREDGVLMDNTHEWCADGIEPYIDKLRGLAVADFPYVLPLIKQGRVVHVPRVADLPPEAAAEKAEFEREGIQSLLVVPTAFQGSVVGFLGFDSVRTEQSWNEDIIALLRTVGEIFANALERKRAEGALRESEEKYRKLVDYTLVGKYIHQDRVFMFCNKRFAEIFGYEGPGEIIGRNIQDFIAPASWNKVIQEIEFRESGEREFSHYELQGVRKDGSLIHVEVLGSQIDYQGKPAIQGSILDVTERRKAEDRLQASLREKEILLQEIHHRVKNNMQVISSLLNLQSKHLSDPVAVEMFQECQHRIRTMALVHESLYKSSDLSKIEFGSYLRSLASHLLHFNEVDTRRIRMETALEEVYLDIQTAIPTGLIANELLSNAMKHAFPGKRSGTIELALRPLPEGSCLLSVKDDGIGFPEGIDIRKTESLGLQIVSSLIDQVDGRLEILRENGTEFRIVFQPPRYPRRGSGQDM